MYTIRLAGLGASFLYSHMPFLYFGGSRTVELDEVGIYLRCLSWFSFRILALVCKK